MEKQTAIQLTEFIQRFAKEKPLYELQSESLTMMPYRYNAAISDFMQFCHDHHLVNPDCYDIKDDLENNYAKNNHWLETLTEKKVVQSIAVLIRQGRFTDGLVSSMIENGTIIKLLNRLKVLHGL
jgi:hypothetical protein